MKKDKKTPSTQELMDKGKLRSGLFEPNKKLHLHLNFEYFDAINRGEKRLEFRLAEKWKRKLDKGQYAYIRLWRYSQMWCMGIKQLPVQLGSHL